jgi:hypothetical protein
MFWIIVALLSIVVFVVTARYTDIADDADDIVNSVYQANGLHPASFGLRAVYCTFEYYLDAGRFTAIDRALSRLTVADLKQELLVGILTITLRAHSKLHCRAAFASAVRNKLSELYGEKRTHDILAGLY